MWNRFFGGKPVIDQNPEHQAEYAMERLLTGIFCHERTNLLVSDAVLLNRNFESRVFTIHEPSKLMNG